MPGTPIKMHGCEDQAMRSAPTVGEDTDDILKKHLHMSDEKISALHKDGIA